MSSSAPEVPPKWIKQYELGRLDNKLTGTGGQDDRMTDGQDHVLSQADALTKKRAISETENMGIVTPSLTQNYLLKKIVREAIIQKGVGSLVKPNLSLNLSMEKEISQFFQRKYT